MRSIVLRACRLFFSTQANQQKQNIFKLPLLHEFHFQAISEVNGLIATAPTCKILAIGFRDNIEYYTAEHLKYLYMHLREYNLQIDRTFDQIIAPISLQYLKVFDREHALVMKQMLLTMIELKIDHKQLWNAILHKLDNQNCYRYIPLIQTAILLNRLLSTPEHAKLSLTRKLIGVVYQQKKFYQNISPIRPIIQSILMKLSKLELEGPKLTEAYKEITHK